MKIAILQHTTDSKPYFTTTWLEHNNLPYRLVQTFTGEPLPAAHEVDWLIALGGSMNIDDEKTFPFLRDEKKLVEEILKAEKTYLGICLGGQMLARVLGAEVKKHSEWEVGWHPVQIENKILGLSKRPEREEIFVMQYHQDTFALPKGAISFAKNSITANQGFIANNGNAVGTQFHPEANESWVYDCENDEFPVGKYVQNYQEMVEGLKHLPKQSAWYSDVLSHLAALTKSRVQR